MDKNLLLISEHLIGQQHWRGGWGGQGGQGPPSEVFQGGAEKPLGRQNQQELNLKLN